VFARLWGPKGTLFGLLVPGTFFLTRAFLQATMAFLRAATVVFTGFTKKRKNFYGNFVQKIVRTFQDRFPFKIEIFGVFWQSPFYGFLRFLQEIFTGSPKPVKTFYGIVFIFTGSVKTPVKTRVTPVKIYQIL
jgi:hypothetical protein